MVSRRVDGFGGAESSLSHLSRLWFDGDKKFIGFSFRTCIAQDKPPLVGKRRKVMNAKITKVLGEKEKEAADMMT